MQPLSPLTQEVAKDRLSLVEDSKLSTKSFTGNADRFAREHTFEAKNDVLSRGNSPKHLSSLLLVSCAALGCHPDQTLFIANRTATTVPQAQTLSTPSRYRRFLLHWSLGPTALSLGHRGDVISGDSNPCWQGSCTRIIAVCVRAWRRLHLR